MTEEVAPATAEPRSHEAAELLLRIRRFDQAEAQIRAALARDPEDARLYVLLGRALKGQEKHDEAESAARKALHLDPNSLEALWLLARLSTKAGRHREAEELLLAGLRLDAENPHLYLAYAGLMQKTGHLEKAEALVRRALDYDSELSAAHGLLGLILSERKPSRAAQTHGEYGVHLAPEHEAAHALFGHTLLATGHPFRARYHLREALKRDPADQYVAESYREADRATRWIYLPMYFWSLWLHRLPGKQFAVWGAAIASLYAIRAARVPETVTGTLVLVYVLFAIYTWVAHPLSEIWLRLRPPR